MVQDRTRGIHLLFLPCQWLLVTAVFWLWLPASQELRDLLNLELDLAAREAERTGSLALDHYLVYHLLILAGVTIAWFTERRASGLFRPNFKSATENAAWSLLFGAGVLFVYLVGTQDNLVSRFFLLGLLPLCYGVLVWSHRYLPPWLASRSFRGPYRQRVLVAGDRPAGPRLVGWLLSQEGVGMQVVGEVTDGEEVGSLPRVGVLADLAELLQQQNVTQVVLADLPRADETLHRITEVCERLGVRLLVHCDFEARFRHPVRLLDEGEVRFIGLRYEPLENPFNRFVKRALDVAIALPVVLLVLPLLTVAIWLLQRAQSPGPVFHRQRRSGIRSQPFDMLKYRSMHVHAGPQERQATRDDDRIYPVGRWLRRLSIDELPQFWNVLHGDMSIVGPRPHLPQHDNLFAAAMSNYYIRAAVKPGITGLAQVRGYRGATVTEEDVVNRVRSDIHYLENWSLELDVSIICRTFWHMLFPPPTAH